MTQNKKIGILTSGGDCAGLNAVIRSVVNCATSLGWTVYGICDGTEGLTDNPMRYEILTPQNFSDMPWPRVAGSYLGSLNKGVKVEDKEIISKKFGEGARKLGLSAVVVIGGDGSMNILSNYCKIAGVNMIGIPKTMDNDTPITELSVGFMSSFQTCTDAVDSLNNTARSHHRAMILEVMGRDAGHLAIRTALAGFADVCLVPEIPYTIDGIINKLKEIKATGRTHSVIVVSEGVKTETGELTDSGTTNLLGERVNGGIGDYLTHAISERYKDFQIRSTKLGHVQRGTDPIAEDRLLATLFGVKAVELLQEGQSNCMVSWNNGKVISVPLEEVVKVGTATLDINSDYVSAARALGMYIGDFK